MLFDSYSYLIFFPIVTLIYFAVPHRWRYLWLFAVSYYFYMCWNATYALLMGLSTVLTYLSGLLLARSGALPDAKKAARQKKWWVFLSFFLNLAILFFFKYFHFALDSINAAAAALGLAQVRASFDVLLPVGISFYTFQALSYTMDVYRGELKPERNLIKYALFVSFFPQLVAGPIERSPNLMRQFDEVHVFDYARIRHGMLRMLWGFFLKMMIADRIALIVNPVFDGYAQHTGFQLLLATVLFAFQVYCDFAGYTEIAIGSAQVMGFTLMENFRQPYFATSIQDFWRRWHISLSTWFRDYLYYPLGGSRCSRVKRYRNILIVFLVSGLWHGASWNYIIWGGLHGAFQIVGDLLRPAKRRWFGRAHWGGVALRWAQIAITFVLVDFAWIFFRVQDFHASLAIVSAIGREAWSTMSLPGLLALMSRRDLVVGAVALALLWIKDAVASRRDPYDLLTARPVWLRWALYVGLTLAILAFGIYGTEYAQTDFIYFQF